MIYDLVTYNNERDILDIRLALLEPYVDKFVICQSYQTFSGKEKPIYGLPNNPKIISILSPNIKTTDSFERAAHQKDCLRTYLAFVAQDEDIVYFGDVDEIWKPQEINDDKVYNLKQLNYSYYLNNRSSEEWIGTIVGKWKTIKTNTLNHWRATHTNVLENGGWHFTNMGGAEEIKRKLESYDHQEYNKDEIKEDLEFNIKNGFDYVGREVDWQGKPFEMWKSEVDLPTYLLDNKDKYAHLFA